MAKAKTKPTTFELATRILKQARGRPRTTREIADKTGIAPGVMGTTLRRAEKAKRLARAVQPRTCTVTGKPATGWLLAA